MVPDFLDIIHLRQLQNNALAAFASFFLVISSRINNLAALHKSPKSFCELATHCRVISLAYGLHSTDDGPSRNEFFRVQAAPLTCRLPAFPSQRKKRVSGARRSQPVAVGLIAGAGD